jgi:TIR domain
MSYADEDDKIAQEIADQLSSDEVSICSTQGSAARRLDRFPSEPALEIQQADIFLALVSPYSMASTLCRQERELALYREQRLHQSGISGSFVQVVQVRQTPYHEAGSLRSQPWFDLTGRSSREGVLKALADNLEPSGLSGGNSARGGRGRPRGHLTDFRNRTKELEAVGAGIASGDECFWLIAAPPQLGKSWFLNEIASKVDEKLPARCAVELVDVHDLWPEAVRDPDAILRLLFGFPARGKDGPIDLSEIVHKLNASGRLHLCLLDGAELLSNDTIRQLRHQLGEINHRLAHRNNPSARFALVAASRRVAEWTGMIPGPRLEILTLTEFKEEIVADELRKAAKDADYALSTGQLQHIAHRVHRLSEGLPALLVSCIAWVQERSFDIDGLEDAATFQRIAGTYVQQALLSPDSLRIGGKLPTDEEQTAIRRAIQLISPYRIITYSHVDHCAEERSLREAIQEIGWSVRDLWEAISGVDLLYRPQRDPWQTIYGPVRRLLSRYWRPDEASRREAHGEAAEFTLAFLSDQSGSDQWRVLLECLWHEAHALGVATLSIPAALPAQSTDRLVRLAMGLAAGLKAEPDSVISERRKFAADCMRSDVEFAEDVDHVPGLYDRLVDAIRLPLPGDGA